MMFCSTINIIPAPILGTGSQLFVYVNPWPHGRGGIILHSLLTFALWVLRLEEYFWVHCDGPIDDLDVMFLLRG